MLRYQRFRFLGFLVLVMAYVATNALAIDIIATFDGGTYIDPNGVDRTNDLHAIVDAAILIWEDIIEDSGTISFNYKWGDLSDNNQKAIFNALTNTITIDTLDSGVPRDLFFDPTPLVNEEFDMSQLVYGNMSPINQPIAYDGAVPFQFEADYKGFAKSGSEADGRSDLLTTVLHEMGHRLGMNALLTPSLLLDFEYDIDPVLAWGGEL